MRVRTDSKRREILEIARASFLKHGYAATSMAAIAAEVGGSKGTLYGYFSSKKLLFTEVVRSVGEEHARPALAFLERDGSLREILTDVARALIRFLLLPQAIASHRLVVAESGRFPELGQAYFESGPAKGEARMAAWIAAQIEAGRLHPADPARLAQNFGKLCEVGPYDGALCGIAREVPAEEQAGLADFAVEAFLRAHASPLGDAEFGWPAVRPGPGPQPVPPGPGTRPGAG